MFLKGYLIPIENLDNWCKKYDLKVKQANCKNCNRILKTDTPFVTNEYRGLFSKPCICGNKKTPFTFIIVDKK
jgi:hypothetical protein